MAGDERLEAVGADLHLARGEDLTSARPAGRRRRRTTLWMRAITSSGWQGLVIQSSAPKRSPRTRWATVEGPVQTTIPRSGSAPQRRSSHSHACGPSTARSTTSADEAHRADRLGRDGAGEHAVLPAEPVEALGEHLDEAAVAVQNGDPQWRGCRGGAASFRWAPLLGADGFHHRWLQSKQISGRDVASSDDSHRIFTAEAR